MVTVLAYLAYLAGSTTFAALACGHTTDAMRDALAPLTRRCRRPHRPSWALSARQARQTARQTRS